eukprot:GHVS01028256.1.p1 GENE.GHVS01028256.1~~GHVS01028256.1.p1  ORF type:complete len:573 (-),score=73.63 GHVS01028256.1:916-2634(-)
MGGGRVEPQAFGPVGLRSGDAQSQAQTAASPSINPAIMLSGGKKECSDGMAEVHFIGQIEFGENFGTSWSNAGLLCEFVVETGDEWVPLSSQADDAVTQLTQVAHVGRGGFCMWSHPLDLYFGTSSVVGWPRLSLQIWAITQTSAKPTAYGTVYLPTSRGHHELICRTWSPAGAYSAELAESYFNKKSYLPTPEAPNSTTRPMDTSIYQTFYEDEETRAKLTTMTSGSVHISLDVITKHFTANGIQLSQNEPSHRKALAVPVDNGNGEAAEAYTGMKSTKASLATAFQSTAATQKLAARSSRPQTASGAGRAKTGVGRGKSGGVTAEPTGHESSMSGRRLGGTAQVDRDELFTTGRSENGESSSGTPVGGWWSNTALKDAVLRENLLPDTAALSADRGTPQATPSQRRADGQTGFGGAPAATGTVGMNREPHGVDNDRDKRSATFGEDGIEEFLESQGGALDGEADIGRPKRRELVPRALAAQPPQTQETPVVQRREGDELETTNSSVTRSNDAFGGSSSGVRVTGLSGSSRQSPSVDEERSGAVQGLRSYGGQSRQLPALNSSWRQGTEGS